MSYHLKVRQVTLFLSTVHLACCSKKYYNFLKHSYQLVWIEHNYFIILNIVQYLPYISCLNNYYLSQSVNRLYLRKLIILYLHNILLS